MSKPIDGTEASKLKVIEPSDTVVKKTEPVSVTPEERIAKALENLERREKEMLDRLEAREQELIKKEKELDSKMKESNVFKPMNEAQRAQVEEIHKSKAERMKEHLEKQPKVRMYIPLEGSEKVGQIHPVVMNGYRLNIPKGVYVDVPQQVADLLRNSFAQTEAAGSQFRLDLSGKEKQDAMTGGLTQG